MTDKGRPTGTDPTITPTQAVGIADTRVHSEATTGQVTVGKLPARYTIGRQLGAGGMGEVVLATDSQIERDVAIKRMRVAPTPSAVARFVREAKVQGRLDHPAIVPVHELANDSEGRPFFVMKRLTGTTLADILEKPGTHTRQKLLRAFADVCLAIEFAHARGVVHRDLKPSNIMLGDFGEVYVLDWGVARILDETDEVHVATAAGRPSAATLMPADASEATEAGAILGTPGYIAPELLRGEPVDPRADVYALGAILFGILTGESLLPPGRKALIAALDTFDSRPSTRTPDRDVPPELDELCVAATAMARDDRPTARALAERIERYLDGDRDLALRKTLAASHLAAARAALAGGDGPEQRATAMREAGRAIALDPKSAGAAELVGRLMLEPPREVPPEVEARIVTIEEQEAHAKVRMLVGVMAMFLTIVPAVLLTGLRSALALAIFIAVVVVNIGVTLYFARRTRPPSRRAIVVSVLVFSLIVVVMSRAFTPFLLAPSITAIAVLLFVADPRAPWRMITVVLTAAVLAPWALEVAGLIPRTLRAVGGDLVMHLDILSVHFPAAEIAIALYVIASIAICGIVASQLGMRQRVALRTVELQAWHLRQLVKG